LVNRLAFDSTAVIRVPYGSSPNCLILAVCITLPFPEEPRASIIQWLDSCSLSQPSLIKNHATMRVSEFNTIWSSRCLMKYLNSVASEYSIPGLMCLMIGQWCLDSSVSPRSSRFVPLSVALFSSPVRLATCTVHRLRTPHGFWVARYEKSTWVRVLYGVGPWS